MLLHSLHVKNTLSLRDSRIDLQPLNILIGPNASGKSNLIETIALLRETPADLAGFFRRNGSVTEWIWKGASSPSTSRIAEIEAVVENPAGTSLADEKLTYRLRFVENNQHLQVMGERLENIRPYQPYHPAPFFYFDVSGGYGRISPRRARDGRERDGGSYGVQSVSDDSDDEVRTTLTPDNFTPTRSVLSEIKDPINFPVLTNTARRFGDIRLYRNWNVGRDSPARRPQPTDDAVDFLEEDFSNLALVVSDIQTHGLQPTIDRSLNNFYEAYQSLYPRVYGGTIQLVANETGMSSAVPATRLSDGTIRFIALLAILCHPKPPELICIEEPELAMHPDSMLMLADLLRSASERSQLVVTTHSPELINQFSDEPEAVIVCERGSDGGTKFSRLSRDGLVHWLDDYRLGEAWMTGAVGGTRY